MNIGLDIDGTINEYPDFFTAFAKAMRAQGHKVFIITGLGDPEKIREKLGRTDIENDGIYYAGHYNAFERSLISGLRGQQASNECVVGAFKQRICKDLGIDIMFDDMGTLHQWFGKTPVFAVPKLKRYD